MEYSNTKQSRANLPEPKKGNGLSIFVAVVTALAVFAGGLFAYSWYQNSQATAHFEEITVEKAAEKAKNDEDVVIIIGKASCSHCQSYKPIAKKFATENNTKFYYVDIETDANKDALKNHSEFAVDGTPTTMYYHKGVVAKSMAGERTSEQIKEDIEEAKTRDFALPKA